MSLLRPGPKDPRHIVTPDAFAVAPELLGRPLARPWRRAAAILADLLFVFLLTRLGSLSASFAAAAIFLALAFRKPVERRGLRWARGALAVAGSFVVFATALVALEWSRPDPYTGMTPGQWMDYGLAAGSQDPEERAEASEKLVSELVAAGAAREQVQPILDSLDLPPELKVSLEDVIAFGPATEAEPAPPLDPTGLAPLLEDYAAALRSADPARLSELGPKVERAVTGNATRRLEKRLESLQANLRELYGENRELRDEVDHPSFTRVFSGLAADLGLTFGWSGLYFTLFVAWGRGRTPGKWLFATRVVRLDHRPLGLWGSFERFAGYAAGLATGLLGFLQVLWDPNRQALQDKIVGTVVVGEARRAVRPTSRSEFGEEPTGGKSAVDPRDPVSARAQAPEVKLRKAAEGYELELTLTGP